MYLMKVLLFLVGFVLVFATAASADELTILAKCGPYEIGQFGAERYSLNDGEAELTRDPESLFRVLDRLDGAGRIALVPGAELSRAYTGKWFAATGEETYKCNELVKGSLQAISESF
jgi:hypothetical protein